MAFYEDLTPYNYHHYSEKELNIGWLKKGQPFNVGETSIGLIDKLKVYIENKNKVFKTRGWHQCEFCDSKEFQGDCEIRVIGKSGIVYASPFLIVHYVDQHSYLPPSEFIDAVLGGLPPDSEEYKKSIARLPESWLKRNPDTNDSDYEEKIRNLMIQSMSESIDKDIIEKVLSKSSDFKKFIESYNSVMPSIYNVNLRNKKG